MDEAVSVARARDILATTFGYREFRGPQARIIEHLAAGHDALVLMPTGGGKSLCYQIPALMRPGTGIVISPLIALMHDQVEALRQLGVRAAFLNSSLDPGAQREVERDLESGALDLLYVAPERLLTGRFLAQLESCEPALFAIDEAHCVSQWGHDFRPDYRQLDVLARRFPEVPRIALTATADERTRDDIAERLSLAGAQRFIASFDRPNITYRVQPRQSGRRQLGEFIDNYRGESGIVYVRTRNKVDSTAEWLVSRSIDAVPYHAGLSASERSANQRRFVYEEGVVVVATIAFGMGIDKPDVRFVAHLDLPRSIESYYQETGRAGRDGEPAEAWMTYGLGDVVNLSQMIAQSEAGDAYKRVEKQKLEALLAYAETTACRRRLLLESLGETYAHPSCGQCDNCLHPPETVDATDHARKFLSCVYRSGQRFGAGHVIDILRGGDTARIRKLGHDQLSTYAIGTDLDSRQWRGVCRQLLAQGLLVADAEGFSTLHLTAASAPLLKGETRFNIRKSAVAGRPERRGSGKAAARSSAPTALPPEKEALWQTLRSLRAELARSHELPAYMIFPDSTLHGMLEAMPATPEQMLEVSGVGTVKMERYGKAFLDTLNGVARPGHNDPTEPGDRNETI
ncbi:MAG: DNA helicase RecQ [Rhodanobacteraceae bacterium]